MYNFVIIKNDDKKSLFVFFLSEKFLGKVIINFAEQLGKATCPFNFVGSKKILNDRNQTENERKCGKNFCWKKSSCSDAFSHLFLRVFKTIDQRIKSNVQYFFWSTNRYHCMRNLDPILTSKWSIVNQLFFQLKRSIVFYFFSSPDISSNKKVYLTISNRV